MKILVLNCGSSSIKFQLFEKGEEIPLIKGSIDKIGKIDARLHFNNSQTNHHANIETVAPDHLSGLKIIFDLLLDTSQKLLKKSSDLYAVVNRVVHGGSKFSKPTFINKEVLVEIKKLCSLAPLHNPLNILGIETSAFYFPLAKQIAVFDTAFHQTIAEKVYRYAIPESYYTQQDIRVYGFHGTSHAYVSEQAIQKYGLKNSGKIISLHLGNGASATAIKNGKSIDTSMGLTPLGGLVMGTRPGDIDASIIFHMLNNTKLNAKDIDKQLNKESGLYGLCGYSDMRDIHEATQKNDPKAKLALEIYTYRIAKYIGSYIAALGGLDILIFTAGVGENDPITRKLICENLSVFNIYIDENKNSQEMEPITEIQSNLSKVTVLVIKTNEELQMAKDGFALLEKL